MTMEQLYFFAALVEEGTISGAARRLHMSQPPVSIQLKNLENECGIRLFERGARQITLTDAGRVLYNYAQKIVELKTSAEDDMKSLKAGKKGSIRLGIASSGTCEEFIRGVAAFRAEHENISFKVYDDNTLELLKAMEKQKIELAVVRTPFPKKGLDVVSMVNDRIVAAGLPEMIDHLPEEIMIKDVKDKPLIIYRRWEKLIRENIDHEKIKVDFLCINDDSRTSLQWAEAGLGVALIPESILPLSHKLSFRRLSEENFSSSICLIKRQDRRVSEGAEEFYRTFQKMFFKEDMSLMDYINIQK
ncbi:MAG: LysR family transcriptional regulator [Lachnospiraceae bacterium]|nr:LysR family transcriptional regulator [Lachnospiraceae bacterium]